MTFPERSFIKREKKSAWHVKAHWGWKRVYRTNDRFSVFQILFRDLNVNLGLKLSAMESKISLFSRALCCFVEIKEFGCQELAFLSIKT